MKKLLGQEKIERDSGTRRVGRPFALCAKAGECSRLTDGKPAAPLALSHALGSEALSASWRVWESLSEGAAEGSGITSPAFAKTAKGWATRPGASPARRTRKLCGQERIELLSAVPANPPTTMRFSLAHNAITDTLTNRSRTDKIVGTIQARFPGSNLIAA